MRLLDVYKRQSIRKKYKKTIWSKFAKAINTYELVKPGDKIAVCISGGKDSMLMAKLFQELKRHNKFDFDVKFLVMDPGLSLIHIQMCIRDRGNAIPDLKDKADMVTTDINNDGIYNAFEKLGLL